MENKEEVKRRKRAKKMKERGEEDRREERGKDVWWNVRPVIRGQVRVEGRGR